MHTVVNTNTVTLHVFQGMRRQYIAPLRAQTFFGSRRDAEKAERAEESRKCKVFAASANAASLREPKIISRRVRGLRRVSGVNTLRVSASPCELKCIAQLNRDSPYLMSQRTAPLRAQTFFGSRRGAELAERAEKNRKCLVSAVSANSASLREPLCAPFGAGGRA
jgi:hypothetical protein